MRPKIKPDPKIASAARSTAEILLITAAAKAAVSKCLEVTKAPRAPLPPATGLTRFLITGDATFGLKMNAQILFALGEGLEKFVGGRKSTAPVKVEPPAAEEATEEKTTRESVGQTVPEQVAQEPEEEDVPAAKEPIAEPAEPVDEAAEEPIEETTEEPATEEAAEMVADVEPEPTEEATEEPLAEAEPEEAEATEPEETEPTPEAEPTEEAAAEEQPEAEEVPAAEESVSEETEAIAEETEETPVAEEPATEAFVSEEPAVEAMAPVAVATSADEETEESEDSPFGSGGNLEYIDVKDEPEAYAALLAQAEAGDVRLVTRYRQSYESRLIQSKDPMQDYYNGIKNALLAYKGVKSRISWANEKFHQGRNHIAKIIVKTSSLYLYLALDPAQLAGTKYESAVSVLSGRKKFETTPVLLKIKGERKYKYALELVEMVCGEAGLALPPNKKYTETDYRRPVLSMEEMVENGLVRMLVAAAPNEIAE